MSALRLRKLILGLPALAAATVLTGGVALGVTPHPPEGQLNNPDVPARSCDFDGDGLEEECFDTNGDDYDDVIRADQNENGRAEVGIVDSDFDGSFEWIFHNPDDNATWDLADQDVDGDGMTDHSWHRQNNGTDWRQDF